MKNAKSKYIHNEIIHNSESSTEFVRFLYDTFKPRSVVDIGCGLGNFLYGFKKCGVKDVIGVDGAWVDREKLSKYLTKDEYIEHNLELPLKLDKKYDLVLSLEVGEHLSQNAAKIHVQNLISAGKIVIFSAAIPFQGGQNHVNEQWQSYWKQLFENEDYVQKDIIRPNLWNSASIPWWYRQNSFVYAHKDVQIADHKNYSINNVIHPELYIAKVKALKETEERLSNLQKGGLSIFYYFKLFLKSIFKQKS